MKTKNTTIRGSVLIEAKELTEGDRTRQYGSPEPMFKRIASLWSGYLGADITSTDATVMMSLMKAARLKENPTHRDSAVDGAAYLGIAHELSTTQGEHEQEKKEQQT